MVSAVIRVLFSLVVFSTAITIILSLLPESPLLPQEAVQSFGDVYQLALAFNAYFPLETAVQAIGIIIIYHGIILIWDVFNWLMGLIKV